MLETYTIFGNRHMIYLNDLIGGPRNDTLTGGPGEDIFVFNLGINDGHAIVTDFDVNEGGTLQFKNVSDSNGDSVIDVNDMLSQSRVVNDGTEHVKVIFDQNGGLGGSIDFTNIPYTDHYTDHSTLADVLEISQSALHIA